MFVDRMFRTRLVKGEERAEARARISTSTTTTTSKQQTTSKSPLHNDNVRKQIRCHHDAVKAERHSRADSMTTFPFVDDRGSAAEALYLGCTSGTGAEAGGGGADETIGGVNLLKTSLPGRMRLITKCYHEISRSGGKKGMKHVDIPVALRSLGVCVAARVEKLLASGGGIHNTVKGTAGPKDPANTPLAPTTITLAQFQEIVKKCLELERKRDQSKSGSDAVTEDVTATAPCLGQLGDNFEDEDAQLVDSILFEDPDGDGEMRRSRVRESPNKLRVRHTNTSTRRRSLNSRGNSGAVTSTGAVGSPNKSSGLRDQIRQDRRFFEQRRRAEEIAADRTIAEHKVDQYLGSHDNSSYFDWRRAGGDGNAEGGSEEPASSAYVSAAHKTGRKSAYSLTRNSGDAAVTIADAFLNGPVARDILRPAAEDHRRSSESSVNIRAFDEAAGGGFGTDVDSDLGENLENVLGAPTGVGSWGNEQFLARQAQAQAQMQDSGGAEGKENVGLRSKAFDHSVFFIQSQAQRSAAAAALTAGRPELGVPPRGGSGIDAAPIDEAFSATVLPQSANDRVSVRERMRRQEDEDNFNEILHGSSRGTKGGSHGASVYGNPLEPGFGSAGSSGSAWKGSRGGWVADFGPLHTRSVAPHEDPSSQPGQSRAAARASEAGSSPPDLFTANRRRDNREAVKRLSETKCFSSDGAETGRPSGLNSGGGKGKRQSSKGADDEQLMDFIQVDQPVRSYAEITETFAQTGVKPWKQMSLLKKYYGAEKSVFKNNEVPEPEDTSNFGTARDDYEAGKQAERRVRALRARQAQADAEEAEAEARVDGDDVNSSVSTVAINELPLSSGGAGSRARAIAGASDSEDDAEGAWSMNVNDNVRGKTKVPEAYRNDITGTETYKYWDSKAAPGAVTRRQAEEMEQILRDVDEAVGDSNSSNGSVDSHVFNIDDVKLPSHLDSGSGSD